MVVHILRLAHFGFFLYAWSLVVTRVTAFRGSGKRIVSGWDAEEREFPFIIAIEQKNHTPGVVCGGSLISPFLVLTAAHCFYDREGKIEPDTQFTLVAGGHNFLIKRLEQRRHIAAWVIHEEYNWTANTNDIALVKVDRPFDLEGEGGAVQVVALASSSEEGRGHSRVNCSVAGWGYLHPLKVYKDTMEEEGYPQILQTVHVNLIDKELCADNYEGKQDEASAVHPKVICAGHLAGGKDACGGDSGGPLVCDEADDEGGRGATGNEQRPFVLVGIVSGGAGCALKHLPGLYTDVVKFLPWIRVTASKMLGDELDF